MRFRSPSPEATHAAARALAGSVAESMGAEGLVVALCGPLGAGKTAFVKGLAAGLGIDPAGVASPTFVIASEYESAVGAGPVRRLAHVDLYRVESAGELDAAGFQDLLEPGALVAVEWADRLPEALPPERLEIRIRWADPEPEPETRAGGDRELSVEARGSAAEAALARWREALAAGGEIDLESAA